MSKGIRIGLLLLLAAVLILVRTFASELFYDPLILFFKTDHTVQALPEIERWKLVLHTSLRFLLTTGVSLAVLWVLFRKVDIIKISLLLYALAFVVLISFFAVLSGTSHVGDHMALFYVRRFLIQPIFLLLLIPAFYFQKKG